MSLEIEKKYLSAHNERFKHFIDENSPVSIKFIKQFYELPNENTEIRLRKVIQDAFATFFKTIKHGDGLVREENETEISSEEYYEELKGFKVSEPISKLRRTYQIGGLLVEVDTFFNEELKDIVLVEIEFDDVGKANAFDAFSKFDFLISDVTDDKKYKNKNLWKSVNA